MGTILAPDDISAGIHVAIHSVNLPKNRSSRSLVTPALLPVPLGVPMQVLEVSLPFVACEIVEPGGGVSGPALLDLRFVRLCRLNDRFVNAITAFETQRDLDDCTNESQDSHPRGGTELSTTSTHNFPEE